MNILPIAIFLSLMPGFWNLPTNNIKQYKYETSKNIIDTTKNFIVDDYPLTFEMIYSNGHSRKSGGITDVEGAWFSNDSLKQTLVFVLYTDGHRLYTFHFLNNDIPPGLINRMELHSNDGEIATNEQKQKDFKGFLSQTTKISKAYFKTDKGFKLGDSKEKALKVYGKPTKKKKQKMELKNMNGILLAILSTMKKLISENELQRIVLAIKQLCFSGIIN